MTDQFMLAVDAKMEANRHRRDMKEMKREPNPHYARLGANPGQLRVEHSRVIGRHGRRPIISTSYSKGGLATITHDDLRTIVDQQMAAHPNMQAMISIQSINHGWRSGRWFGPGQAISVWSPQFYYDGQGDGDELYLSDDDAEGMVNHVTITLRPIAAAGGAGEHNDCLWDELVASYGGNLPKGAPQTPEALKKILGLKRDDPVPVDKLEAVSRLFNVAINVSGDASFISGSAAQRRIDLLLSAGHYSSDRSYEDAKVAQRTKPGFPVLWGNEGDKVWACFRKGDAIATVSRRRDQKWWDRYKDERFCFLRVMPKDATRMLTVEEKKLSRQEQMKLGRERLFEKWTADRKALFDASKGKVDLFITTRYADAAARDFQRYCGAKLTKLPPVQQEFVAQIHPHFLRYAKKGFEGKATQYDFNSFYPSILARGNGQTWPTGEGTFATLKGKQQTAKGVQYWEYGIYRTKPLEVATLKVDDSKCIFAEQGCSCRHWSKEDQAKADADEWHEQRWGSDFHERLVDKLDDAPGVTMFHPNETHHYTHYDLQVYEKVTGKVPELVQDGKPNALVWKPNARASGSVLFGPYVKFWFAQKRAGVPAAKEMLNNLWGGLCMLVKNVKTFGNGFFIPENEVIMNITTKWNTFGPNSRWEVTTRGIDIFKGVAPAIGVFLTARARQLMGEAAAQYGDKVVRIATDSMIIAGEHHPPVTGKELGLLKKEHEGVVAIKHLNACVWSGCACAKCKK